jgi:WD40 repeat protein
MNGSATFWDSANGEMLGKLRLGERSYGLATLFHPHGGILSAGPGCDVILATSHRPVSDRLLGHQASLRVLKFSPDGQTVASAGLERVIRLWDVAAAQERKPYAGHSVGVAALAWSPDGRRLFPAVRTGSLASGTPTPATNFSNSMSSATGWCGASI